MVPTQQYQKVQVMTADKVRLIIMLYEGVMNFNKRAQMAIEAGDIDQRNKWINKSMAIVSELNDALNMEVGGEVASNLRRLYFYVMTRLTEANVRNDAAQLDVVNRIMGELKAGWEGIASENSAAHRQEKRPDGAGIHYGV
ncbi:MAG TPA: flagellar export chaperone FliS [Deltaproteobacteria bacterium]|nr:flagellar export chaperone FliS [Deltaproteobacteria bacterium]